MSDNYLRLVPHDPFWQPTPDAVTASIDVLREFLPAADSVGAESGNGVKFFDAGGNSEHIFCPVCGADLEGWWGNAMDEAWNSSFKNLSVITPCCGSPTSLNDLNYVGPMAFGVFALVIANPDIKSFSAEQLGKVESVLNSPLKVVWQHI